MVKVAIIRRKKLSLELGQYVYPLITQYVDPDAAKEIKNKMNQYIWSQIADAITIQDVEIPNGTSDGVDQSLSHGASTNAPPDLIETIGSTIYQSFPRIDYNNIIIHNEISFITPRKLFQFSYGIAYNDSCKLSDENYRADLMNDYAAIISLNHTVTSSNIVLCSYAYVDNSESINDPHVIDPQTNHQLGIKLVDITQYDLIKLVRRRYFNSCTMITQNAIKKYYFQDPRDLIKRIWGITNVEFYESEQYMYKLHFFEKRGKDIGADMDAHTVNKLNESNKDKPKQESDLELSTKYLAQIDTLNKQQTGDYTNEIATRIFGKKELRGDILIFSIMRDEIYGSLTTREIKRLNVLSYGNLNRRNPENFELKMQKTDDAFDSPPNDSNEEESSQEKKQEPVLWNRYLILDKLIKIRNEFGESCMQCQKKLVNSFFQCKKCFRVRTCSLECNKLYIKSANHQCLFNTDERICVVKLKYSSNDMVQYLTSNEDNQVTPSNEDNQVTPSNEDNQVTPSNEDNQVTPSNEDNQVTPSNKDNQVTPSNEDNQVTPSNEDNQVTPLNEDNQVTTSNEDNQVTPLNEDNQVTTSNEDNQVTPLNEDNQVTSSNEDNQVTSSNEDNQVTPLNEDN
jgi:hypothetical protein